MSDVENPSGKTSEAGGQAGSEAANDKVSYSTYQKVLSEKKSVQSKFEELQARMEAIETEKLEAAGKLKEVNETLRKQLLDKDAQLKKTMKTFGERVLKESFTRKAESKGCVSPEDLWKLAPKEGLEVTEDFSFKDEDLESLITEVQKSKPWLFKNHTPAPKDGALVNGKAATPTKGLSEMKTEDIIAALKAVR